MINGRPFIAVITARPSEREQKIMLEGIMSEAEKYGFYIAVIANIYNISNIGNYFTHVAVENKIYELAESERIDGVILMLETVSYSDLKEEILEKLAGKKIPIVVAGDVIEGYTCINNDIRKDFHEIAHHITEIHGFTDIDIITGQAEYETSHERVQGMRDVLEEKGINFSDENIIFSNYWITGGEKIANEYISGKRRLPQAIVCGNDYMAYGLIDTFFKNGITPPEDVTVVGYEYSGERYYHSPILTTYYRNRSAVGANAMNVLYSMISGNKPENNVSLNGCMVCGDTCSCGIDKKFLGKELEEVRTAQFYNSMTVCGNFEQKLAVCRSLSDYIRALQDYSYLIRNLKGLYLCLYEDWFSLKEKSLLDIDSNDKMMTFYRLISPIEYPSEPHYFVRKMLFPENLPGSGDKLFLYFVPMFTDGTEIGYFIFQYTTPDSYDPIAVDWINSAVNALNVIRMKNDINELLEYNNLSAFRDTTTGLYNKKGIMRELEHSLKKSSADDTISAVMIKARPFFDSSRIDEKNISVKIDLEISECLKKAAIDSSAFCAKLQDKQFLFAAVGKLPENYDKIIADRVMSLITHSPLYQSAEYMDNIISAGITCNISEIDTKNLIDKLADEINKETALLFEKYKTADYNKYNILRTSIYKSPEKQWNAETVCRDFHISSGHFRAEYKNIFGLSFHKDIIQSRIAMAKYLLMTTSLNLPAIAVKCGYDDDKYFIRQFRQITGISPNAYRKFSVVS